MKKTRSMIYTPSHEARELYLYASNCAHLADLGNNILENLRRKVLAGVYDHEKAVAAMYRFACEGSKLYNRDFGYTFDVTARYTAACDLVRDFELDELGD